jgi:Cu-Zn family superoxide dismutase
MSQWKLGKLTTPAFALALVLAFAVVGCGKKEESPAPAPAPETPAPAPTPVPVQAVTKLQGAEGSGIEGAVEFVQAGDTVTIAAYVSGVEPGEHGFHIHEAGVCEGDFTSSGDHFNPTDHPHGAPGEAESHAGDLGNITVGEDGTGSLELTSTVLTVDPGPNSVVGKAVILHEKPDDLESQPTGAAGGRIACGVVQLVGGDAGDAGDDGGDDASGEEDGEGEGDGY